MIYGISHIGIGVRNIENTLKAFSQALDIPMPSIRISPERKTRFAVLSIGGMGIEFLEDNSESGRVAEFVRKRGNCIEHICFLTDNIEIDMELVKQRNFEFDNEKPNIGLRGKKVAFSSKGLNGIRFELSEP